MIKSKTIIFFLLPIMLLVENCVIIPIPLNEDKVLAGKPVTEEQLSFLTVATTTKLEVIEHLGKPPIIWEDKDIFIYNWDMRQGILIWAIGGAGGGAAGVTDIAKHYLLLIKFDEMEKISQVTRTTRPLTQSYADFLKEWIGKSEVMQLENQGDKKE